MKKLFLALLAVATVSSASAQPKSILVYGDVNFSSVKAGDNSASGFGINPGVGYQLNNNWTVGVSLAYNMLDSTSWSKTGIKTSNWGAGLFARYTHPMGNLFYCFGQADLMYKSYSAADNEYATSVGIMVTPAIGMNLGKGYALNFSLGGLGYTSVSPKGGGDATGTLVLNFGQTMSIGLSKNFGCHMKKHKKHGDDDMSKGDDDDAPKKGKKAKKGDDE